MVALVLGLLVQSADGISDNFLGATHLVPFDEDTIA